MFILPPIACQIVFSLCLAQLMAFVSGCQVLRRAGSVHRICCIWSDRECQALTPYTIGDSAACTGSLCHISSCCIGGSHGCVKVESHRIVQFLDRTIGCDWAKVRPIGNVCYDLQQRSHTAIDLYAWSRYHERLENIDGKGHRRE